MKKTSKLTSQHVSIFISSTNFQLERNTQQRNGNELYLLVQSFKHKL